MDRRFDNVLDLPQLHQQPSHQTLISTLDQLAVKPTSWDVHASSECDVNIPSSTISGLPRYLTSIVASDLSWINDEAGRERVWEIASARLCERAGRSAMPSMTRTFTIPATGHTDKLRIVIHEPSLTSDRLGLKTWASSFLLAKRLSSLLPLFYSSPDPHFHRQNPAARTCMLELGAGTGLVGIAAAALFGAQVHLTDLPDIIANLTANVHANSKVIDRHGGSATIGVLDWQKEAQANKVKSDDGDDDDDEKSGARYGVILVADPLYSASHPRLLVETIKRWLRRNNHRDNDCNVGMAVAEPMVVVEIPLREAYKAEVQEFKKRMLEADFEIRAQGEEVGYDDWGGSWVEGYPPDNSAEVRCWWVVWAWST